MRKVWQTRNVSRVHLHSRKHVDFYFFLLGCRVTVCKNIFTINHNHMHLHGQQNKATYGTVHTHIYYLIYWQDYFWVCPGVTAKFKCKQADSLLSLPSDMHVLGKEVQLSYSHPWDINRLQKRSMIYLAVSNGAKKGKDNSCSLQSNNAFPSVYFHIRMSTA